MEKHEFRVLIKHCFLIEINTVQTEEWLKKYHPTSAPSDGMIKKRFRDFRLDRTSTEDAERSGRPNEAVIPENVEKIQQIFSKDRKVKIRVLAEAVKISVRSVWIILHEYLGLKKLCARWVPRFLNEEQKKRRVDDSMSNLVLFRRNPKEFLRRYVTVDETWIHHYTPESNRQSAEWLPSGESKKKMCHRLWAT